MPDPVDFVKRQKFFEYLFGKQQGFLCLAKKTPGTKGLTEEYFRYPDELAKALFWIDEQLAGYDLYFCAQLLSKPKRVKENVTNKVGALWADLDACPPEKLLVNRRLS
jgi:hypothetical protein